MSTLDYTGPDLGTTKLGIISTKGGVGKTTLAANLAGLLVDLGQRVLLVDTDIQPSASSYYRIATTAPLGSAALIQCGELPPDRDRVVSRTDINRLDLVYSDLNPAVESWVLHTSDGRLRLRNALRSLAPHYDAIVVDSQGAAGPLMDAVLLAVDQVVTPVPPQVLAAKELTRGTLAAVDGVQSLRRLTGSQELPVQGLLYMTLRTTDSQSVADALTADAFLKDRPNLQFLNTRIPHRTVYPAAATARMPVHRKEPAPRATDVSALQTMCALARELFPHLADAADALEARHD